MRWQLPLILAAAFLTTSCSHSVAFIEPALPVRPVECRLECPVAPEPFNPPRAYVLELLKWGSECRDLHNDCITQLGE